MSREDQYNVTVVLDPGTPQAQALGTFDKMSGGEIDSEELKYRPGAMGDQVSLGGSVSVGNVTVTRLYELSRDHAAVPAIRARIGKATATITKQPLDVNGKAFGTPIVYSGTLKLMTLPDHNSESTDAAMLELEFSIASMT